MHNQKLIINIFILIILSCISCRSSNKEQIYLAFYKKEVKQWALGDKAIKISKKFAVKARKEPEFKKFLQNQITKESNHNIRATLYALFHNYNLKPSLMLVKAMLNDKDLTICSLGLAYSERHKYTEVLQDQIYLLSKKESNECFWERKMSEKQRQEYTQYIRNKAKRILSRNFGDFGIKP